MHDLQINLCLEQYTAYHMFCFHLIFRRKALPLYNHVLHTCFYSVSSKAMVNPKPRVTKHVDPRKSESHLQDRLHVFF